MASLPDPTDTAAPRALEIGSRLAWPPSPLLIDSAFRKELAAQLPLFDALSRVDLVHTLVLMENGVLPETEGASLLRALLQLRDRPADFVPDPAAGDLYTNREAWLIGKTPAAAWLGSGRARREAITAAFTIKLREALLLLSEALSGFASSLLTKAETHRTALMADYTYLQAAQPTSFGHYLLGFAYPVLRDLERTQQFYRRLNRSPAGCGSSNGSRLPQSRRRQAELLGFEDLVSHARDAMWQADLPIELAALATAIMINLDRLAEDMQIFASDEFGLLSLHDSHARASKIMPQKKNPFALTHIRGLANCMIGRLAAAAATGRTPSGQPDNRLSLYGSLTEMLTETAQAVALLSEVVEMTRFNDRRAGVLLDRGFAMASDLAEVLVLETGLPFRDAHRLVGRLVRKHLAVGNFSSLTPSEISDCATDLTGRPLELTSERLAQALNPDDAIATRQDVGGAAAMPMAEMQEECRRELLQFDAWRLQKYRQLAAADQLLETAIQRVLTSSAPAS